MSGWTDPAVTEVDPPKSADSHVDHSDGVLSFEAPSERGNVVRVELPLE